MNTSTDTHRSLVDESSSAVEVSGLGLRALEVALVALGGLIVTPFLGVMVVVVAVPTVAILGLVAAVAAPVAVSRRVLAHHRTHESTLFLHRLNR